MNKVSPTLIGFIVPFRSQAGGVVWCKECARKEQINQVLARHPIPLYRESILSYRQDCHICGARMVEQDNPSWMLLGRQLYPNLIPALPKLNQDGGLSPQIPSNNEPRP